VIGSSLVLAASLALAHLCDTGEVAVMLTAGDRAPADEDAWVPARLSDLVAERLVLLGIPVRDRRFCEGGAPGLKALVQGSVRPSAPAEPKGAIQVDAEIKIEGQRIERKKLSGKGDALEALANELALGIARAIKAEVSSDAEALLAPPEHAFDVHRALGLARAELDSGGHRKAMLAFDRASKLEKLGAIPEALDGRLLAEAELVTRGETEFGARADLAPSAEERAGVALKNNNAQEALRALEAFLRYTPERALRWSVGLTLDKKSTAVITRGQRWIVQGGEGDRRRWTIDPRTGVVLLREASLRGLVDATSGQPLVLDERSLARVDEQGRMRWKVTLPARPRSLTPDAIDLSSGLAGIIGERSVAWIEVSFGSVAQVADNVKPMASGTGGVVVEMTPPKGKVEDAAEIGLLRPGKKTPAWVARVQAPKEAAMTVDRVLVVGKDGLVLLRAHDGKEASRAIPVAIDARIIGAEGRYAALATAEGDAMIVDVLAGERTASFKGPGPAIAAYTSASGMAILYATGDLIFHDRDGKMLDRALVPGEPIALLRGSPIAPGPVAVSTHGLFAFAEAPSEARMRDVDALLRLAGVFARLKEDGVALRLARFVAMRSAGRIAEAESLRAELLLVRPDPASKAAGAWAKKRAELARDRSKAVPPFALLR
jgi:tetratricopeptide (TPR) repeat protein